MKFTGWAILLAAFFLMVFMTHPNRHRSRMKPWLHQRFAHRGLHGQNGIVENTLPAFEAACAAGYGIELDIQLTADGRLAVFHDDTLERMCGIKKRVSACTMAELQALRLCGAPNARIPTLEEVLRCVGGRVPLLIELKNGPGNNRLCAALMAQLRDYPGPYLVQSFSPLIVGWFRRNAPQVVRGQLVCPIHNYIAQASRISGFFMAGLMLNCIGRPDFVSYDAATPRFFSHHFQRFMFRTPMAAWTVRTPELARLIEARGEICIFERIRP